MKCKRIKTIVCLLAVCLLVGCKASSQRKIKTQSESSQRPVSSFEEQAIVSAETTAKTDSIMVKNNTASENSKSESSTESRAYIKKEYVESQLKKATHNSELQANEPKIITSISSELVSYSSANEQKPYIKSKAIYEVLYSGERIQIGDTVEYKITVTPNNSEQLKYDFTDNLSCSFADNILTVTVNSKGEYGIGRISFYGLSTDGHGITAEHIINFVIDDKGDPFNSFGSLLSRYLSNSGMVQEKIAQGYAYSDSDLSITHYLHTNAWDDMIKKAEDNFYLNCFNLIDEYKRRGFKKVDFIISNTEAGFSAAK